MPFGLSQEQIGQIKSVIAGFPQVVDVLLFGSQAEKTQHQGSDIDLTLVGEIAHKDLLDIKSRLNALNYLVSVRKRIVSEENVKVKAREVQKSAMYCAYMSIFWASGTQRLAFS